MKRCFLILIAVVLTVSCTNKNPVKYEYSPETTYDWDKLLVQERILSNQIPEHILAAMTTEELIQAFLDYPWVALMFAYNSLQDGFERVAKDFNGLPVLLKRNDLFIAWLEYYKTMDTANIDSNWTITDFMYIEMLIGQDFAISQISDNDIKELFIVLLDKYQAKVDKLDIYGIIGLRTTALPMGRIMRLKRYENEKFNAVLNTPGIEDYLNDVLVYGPNIIDILNIIVETAVEYSGYRENLKL